MSRTRVVHLVDLRRARGALIRAELRVGMSRDGTPWNKVRVQLVRDGFLMPRFVDLQVGDIHALAALLPTSARHSDIAKVFARELADAVEVDDDDDQRLATGRTAAGSDADTSEGVEVSERTQEGR